MLQTTDGCPTCGRVMLCRCDERLPWGFYLAADGTQFYFMRSPWCGEYCRPIRTYPEWSHTPGCDARYEAQFTQEAATQN